jgi:hypothetical protein
VGADGAEVRRRRAIRVYVYAPKPRNPHCPAENVDAGGHGHLPDQAAGACGILASSAVSIGIRGELLKVRISSPIVSWREGEDWVIAWSGDALRGKSGLQGQGAG